MQQRLYRSEADRMLGGVAGGLAERFGWDPTLVRLAWVLVALLSSGALVLVYLTLWLITPTYSRVHGSPQDKGSAAGQARPPNWRVVVGLALITVGAVALLGATGSFAGPGWAVTAPPWSWHGWTPMSVGDWPWDFWIELSDLWPVVLIVVGAAVLLLRSQRARAGSATDGAHTNGETAEDKQPSP